MLTNEQIQHYLENSDRCPVCKSEDITGQGVNTDIGIAWQDVSCNECCEQWKDVYTLTGIEDV